MQVSNGFPRLGVNLHFGGSGKSVQIGLFYYWSVYIKFKAAFLKGILPRDRDFGITFWPERWLTISFQFYHQETYDSADVRGFKKYIRLQDSILGRNNCQVETLERGKTFVSMPEKVYDATYKIEKRTWHYPRWPFYKPTLVGYEIAVEEGVPVMGKGENSWDCGMDYQYSMYTPRVEDINAARREFAMGILKTRQRRGGLDGYLNVPSGMPRKREAPETDINAKLSRLPL